MIPIHTIGARDLDAVLGRNSPLAGRFDASPIYTAITAHISITGSRTREDGESLVFSVNESFVFTRVPIKGSSGDGDNLISTQGDYDIGIVVNDDLAGNEILFRADKALLQGISMLFSPTHGAFVCDPASGQKDLSVAAVWTIPDEDPIDLTGALSFGMPLFVFDSWPTGQDRKLYNQLNTHIDLELLADDATAPFGYYGEFSISIADWSRGKWRDFRGTLEFPSDSEPPPAGWDASTVVAAVSFEIA